MDMIRTANEAFTVQQVICAIEEFLKYGEDSFVKDKEIGDLGQGGYFRGNGWAARCLRFHLSELNHGNS